MDRFGTEAQMLPKLITYLGRSKRIRPDSVLVPELSWFGRRVDLAVLTKSGSTSAYELKLSKNFAAVEQAALNALSFDRSFAVIATSPSRGVLQFAEEVGVGIIQLTPKFCKCILFPKNIGPENSQVGRKLRDFILVKSERRIKVSDV